MSKSVGGIYIEYEYVTFVRVDAETGGITNTEIIALDTSSSPEKSVIEGLKELKDSKTFIKGEPVYFAFQSEQTISFQSELAPEVEDIHEALSWELLSRTDLPLNSFSFVTIPLGTDRALGMAQPQLEIKKNLKLLKKVGIKPAGLSLPVVSLVNLMEINYGVGKETVLFHVSAPTSFIIYVRDGMLWDVRMVYGIDETVSSEELVPLILSEFSQLKKRWSINNELLTKMSGSLITNAQIKAELVKALPNCYELNCFEKIENNTGNDLETILKFNPTVSVAAGLALSGVK